MKFCQAHWDQLKEAVRRKGMWRHVAESGAAVMRQTIKELEGTKGPEDFDPLMGCFWMILNRVVQETGLQFMQENSECPLCSLDSQLPGDATEWIEGCTDAARAHCQELGLPVEKEGGGE